MSSLDQILLGCRQQNADCQKQLYQNYFGIMMRIARRYASSEEDAEEMLNNGFLKIFVHINSYEGSGSLEGWMKRIMVNSCLDFLKQKDTKQRRLSSSVHYDSENGNGYDTALYKQGLYDANGMEIIIEREDVLPMLNLLPEVTKIVFNLFVFEGYTHKEIANTLGVAERTSQWHMRNAKTILAEYILHKKNEQTKAVAQL